MTTLPDAARPPGPVRYEHHSTTDPDSITRHSIISRHGAIHIQLIPVAGPLETGLAAAVGMLVDAGPWMVGGIWTHQPDNQGQWCEILGQPCAGESTLTYDDTLIVVRAWREAGGTTAALRPILEGLVDTLLAPAPGGAA